MPTEEQLLEVHRLAVLGAEANITGGYWPAGKFMAWSLSLPRG
jgi:hypothetical protein